jgi:hypothetical protein
MITSAAEFVRLASSDDPAEYGRAAHESAEVALWMEIIQDYPDARFAVAHNKTVPLEILASLASDPDDQVRSTVSVKRKLTPEILETMTGDPSSAVRLNIARHRNASRRALEVLAQDEWPKVAQLAAERLEALREEDA